jgi:phospholipid/cholesterol/gamma-HCH transport system substrate-binding protein
MRKTNHVAKLSQEFRVGTLVVVGIALLILGVNFLKGFNPFRTSQEYFALYAKIDGLAVSNPVLVNGYKVGQVTQVRFAPNGSGELIVAFEVDQENLRVPKDTKARIFSSDLFGTKAIELLAGQSEELAVPGDTLISDIEMGIADAVRVELMPLKNKTDQLIDGVDDILENLKAVFEADATLGLPTAFESIQRTVESLEQTSLKLDGMVAENRAALNSIFNNVESVTTTLKNHNADLANVMENFSDISDSLAAVNFAQTLSNVDKVLADFASISGKIERGEGSLGLLIQSDSLHDGLMQTNQELQYLLNDLYLNPWRYVKVSVFSKKNEKKLSEKEINRLRALIDEQIEAQQAED